MRDFLQDIDTRINGTALIAVAAAAGLLAGVMIGSSTPEKDSYCEEIERNARAEQAFNGSIACHPPGVYPVNTSEGIANKTDLRCICRLSKGNFEKYVAITTPQTR